MIYFADVDIVWKLTACGFLDLLPELLRVDDEEVTFTYLPSLTARLRRKGQRLGARQEQLDRFLTTNQPIQTAVDTARQQALIDAGLDSGESLLFAHAEATGGTVLTGDKNAIRAYGHLLTESAAPPACVRVTFFEQLLLLIHEDFGYRVLQEGCCQATSEDGALRLIFSNGLATPEADALEGIQSHIRAITTACPNLFHTG